MKKTWLFLVFLCLLKALPLYAQPLLFPLPDQSGKWGYADQSGKMVIAPRFLGAGPFHEGRAIVAQSVPGKEEIRYDVIDETGQIRFHFPIDLGEASTMWNNHYHRFSEGKLVLSDFWSTGDKVYKFYDREGKIVFQFPHQCENYPNITNFSEGLAYGHLNDSTYAYFDEAGNVKIKSDVMDSFVFDRAFFHGLAIGNYSLYGEDPNTPEPPYYIDKNGQRVDNFKIPKDVVELGTFEGGYAFLGREAQNTEGGEYKPLPPYIMDRQGKITEVKILLQPSSPVTYVNGYNFFEGLALVQELPSSGEYIMNAVFITPDGEVAWRVKDKLAPLKVDFNEHWIMGGNFHQGLSAWEIGWSDVKRQLVYLDKTGKIAFASPIYSLH
ncbi:MAG: hypothetical protein OHK0053_14630 [Microscillaceae bacterium]